MDRLIIFATLQIVPVTKHHGIQPKVIFRHTFDRLRSRKIEGESDERRKKGDDGSRRHRGGCTARREGETLAYAHVHACTYIQARQTDRLGMLRRTYYGARQYLNTLDGKVVHEGEIGTPLCSGVRRVRARGWTEKTMNQEERRNISERERERERVNREKGRFAHAARAASTKGWNRLEAIHSFGCPVFFPRVWLGEHRRPPSCRFSSAPLHIYPPSLPPLSRSLRLQVHSITISFPFFLFCFVPPTLSVLNYVSFPYGNPRAKYLGTEIPAFFGNRWLRKWILDTQRIQEREQEFRTVRFEISLMLGRIYLAFGADGRDVETMEFYKWVVLDRICGEWNFQLKVNETFWEWGSGRWTYAT